MSYEKSEKKFIEAKKYLAGGVSSHFRLIFNPVPLTYKNAKGSKITDIDDNEYIDYALAAGPMILGHAPTKVLDAVRDSLDEGQLYYGQHEREVILAKKIIEIIPSAERVRFASSGSEAMHASIRVSRAYSKKNLIIKFDGQYHGWFDNQFISINPLNNRKKEYNSYGATLESIGQSLGAAEDVLSIPWNDINIFKKTIDNYKNQIAAIIMEPVMCNTCVITPQNNYLEEVRKICTDNNIILIFDEVITGFRISLGGAQEFFNVIPDISIFAKGIASGFSISCIVGKKEIMELFDINKVVHGGTYNSSVVNTAAALETIKIFEKENPQIFSSMDNYRKDLESELLLISKKNNININIQGIGSIFHLSFTNKSKLNNYADYLETNIEKLHHFVKIMQDNKIRITGRGTWFISSSHSKKDFDETVISFEKTIKNLNG
jgi:glutamate-1-semialdehyde 2,1-aminomutase